MAGKRVDINVATVEDFATLAGVGRSKAESIIERRQSLGGFQTVEELLCVPGIGAGVVELNRSLLTCGSLQRSSAVARRRSPGQRKRGYSKDDNSGAASTQSSPSDSQGVRVAELPSSSQQASDCSANGDPCPVCGSATRARFDSCGVGAWKKTLVPETFVHGRNQGCHSQQWIGDMSGSDPDDMDDGEGDEECEDEDGEEEEEEDGLGIGGPDDCFDGPLTNGSLTGSVGDLCLHKNSIRDMMEQKSSRDKSLMKRKSDDVVDDVERIIGKKSCLPEEIESITNDCKCEVNGDNENVKLVATVECQTPKKRLPAKPAPPPDLPQWLLIFQRWNNVERLIALNQLIDMCEPTQVRHMMNIIEPQFQRDFISLLPKELALYVLSFLGPRDLLRAAQTCRYWRVLAEDNLLWREKCREAGIEAREVLGKRKTKVGAATSPWKAAFMRQHNIEMNWRCRPIRPPKVLKGHDDHVITCLQFSGSRIVSGSDDNTLKVWSATTGKCLRTLVGHTGGVWSSQMSGSIIVSGSTDRTLKVWNADTGHCIHTLYGHTSTVRCMHLHGTKVVSGSRDATLRIWDIETGECLHVLVGHVAAVRCVQYDGRLVVSGAYDYMVKVWNPEREECLHTLQGHTNRVYSLQFDGTHVVSGSLDTSIRVWDVETGACKHTLMGHQSLTSGMELKNNILVSGNADSTVKVWDITTGQCLQTLSGPNKHLSAVTCLQFNSKFVITSSDDGTVKLWDLKTGDFIRNLVALESGGSGGVVWRIRASPTKLVCAVGSRNGTEETKLLVLDFDVDVK